MHHTNRWMNLTFQQMSPQHPAVQGLANSRRSQDNNCLEKLFREESALAEGLEM